MSMATETPVLIEHGHRPRRASCQCEGPHRCGLPRLERPVFHPGQLLTAESLQLGQLYTEQRLALRRFVDGIGIVCGMEVRCHPSEPGHVIIGPGYAIDCCGEDLVLDEPLCVDVGGSIAQCFPGVDPCGKQDVGSNEIDENGQTRYVLRLERNPVGKAPVAVVLGRGDGERKSECRNSQETIGVTVCIDPASDVCHDDVQDNHTREFRRISTELLCDIGVMLAEAPRSSDRDKDDEIGKIVADALLLAISEQHPSTLCSLPAIVTAQRRVLRTSGESDDAKVQAIEKLVRNLIGLIDDRRQEYLRRECEQCCNRTGVAVAEVLVELEEDECQSSVFRLVAIDRQPPAREALHPRSDWWRSTEVPLFDAYFRDVREACVILTGRGLNVTTREIRGSAAPRDEDATSEEREISGLRVSCPDIAAAEQVKQALSPWIRSYGGDADLRLLGIYKNSFLFAPCSASVLLWTVCARVVSIQIVRLGDVPRHTASASRSFREYVRYTSGAVSWPGRLYIPPAPRREPDPLDEAINGIGPKTEAALFRGGLWTLEQLAAVPYEAINDLVSPVLLDFRHEEFDAWVKEARSRLGDPGGLRKLRSDYGETAKKRFRKALGEGP